jgi:hypothetical protein
VLGEISEGLATGRGADMGNENLRSRYDMFCFELGALRFFSKGEGRFQ